MILFNKSRKEKTMETVTEAEQDPLGPSWVQKPLCVPHFLFVEKGWYFFSFISLNFIGCAIILNMFKYILPYVHHFN